MQLRKTSSALRGSNRMFNNSGINNQKQRRFCVRLFFTLLVVVFTVVVYYPSTLISITISKSQITKMEDQQQQQQQKINKSAATIRYKPVYTKIYDNNNMNVLRFAAYYMEDDDAVSVADWIRLMTGPDSSELARNLTEIMRNSKFQAYRFETPGPLSSETVSSTPFEFVLVEDTYLASFASRQDPNAFAKYLSPSSSCTYSNINNNNDNNKQQHPPAGCVFKNLGGDAILVAPNNWSSSSKSSEPSSSTSSYCAHLANFIREASEEQIIQLWRLVAETLKERLLLLETTSTNTRPIWFSTAGTGVAWLHFRLDNRPKYYLYHPFKMFSPDNKK